MAIVVEALLKVVLLASSTKVSAEDAVSVHVACVSVGLLEASRPEVTTIAVAPATPAPQPPMTTTSASSLRVRVRPAIARNGLIGAYLTGDVRFLPVPPTQTS